MTPHDDLIRAKAEAEALKIRGSYDAPGFDACVEAIILQQAAKEGDGIGSPVKYTDGSHSREYEDQPDHAPVQAKPEDVGTAGGVGEIMGKAYSPAPSDEVVERVAKAICRAGHDDDADFEESWKEHRVGYIIEAGAAIAAMPKQPVDLEAAMDEIAESFPDTFSEKQTRIMAEACAEAWGLPTTEGEG